MPKLLLLEDDAILSEGLSYALEKEGYGLIQAASLAEAERAVSENGDLSLLILDVTLPDGNSFALCEKLRQAGIRAPILFLTAADDEVSVVRGLDSGGDDYLTKPFRLHELLSRIRALLRRASVQPAQTGDGVLVSGDLCIEPMKSRATLSGRPVSLTAGEFRLLCLLVKHANQTLTRSAILDALWDGCGSFVDDNTLSVYVRRLREKLEDDPSDPQRLVTVRGFGYQWKEARL